MRRRIAEEPHRTTAPDHLAKVLSVSAQHPFGNALTLSRHSTRVAPASDRIVAEAVTSASPAFEIREARLVVRREPAAATSSTVPAAAYMLIWRPRERMPSRVVLPLWMSKVATEPIPLEALAGVGDQDFGALMEAKRAGNELNIRIGDLERYGRTLLLDGVTADGKHVMMWNE